MRIRFTLANVLIPLLLVACDDSGILPVREQSTAAQSGPLTSGECVPNDEGVFICPPISGGGGECDIYHYDCGGDDCISAGAGCSGAGGNSGPGWTGGGGPGDGPAPPSCPDYDPYCQRELPVDTCVTDDPMVNDPAIEAAFGMLWKYSNPNAPQAERQEQAAWIVPTQSGVTIVPWTNATFGPCTITPHSGSFRIPQDAIGWIHTHPFTVGELQTSCAPIGYTSAGEPIHGRYSSFPNQEDIELGGVINQTLGRNIPAYTIDRSTIVRFLPTSTTTVSSYTSYGRCGY